MPEGNDGGKQRTPHFLIRHAMEIVVGAVVLALIGWGTANYEDWKCDVIRFIQPNNTLAWNC